MVETQGLGQRSRRNRRRRHQGSQVSGPQRTSARREDRSFDDGHALFQWHDPRPPLVLWSTFVTTVTEQLGSLTRDFQNEMRSRAVLVAAHYPLDAETWRQRASEWQEIVFDAPDQLSLIIKAGPSIQLEFHLLPHGAIDVKCTSLPEGEEYIRPFQGWPRSFHHAKQMAKGKTEIITKLICRHLDPVSETIELVKLRASAPKTIEPEWHRDGGSRQSTRGGR